MRAPTHQTGPSRDGFGRAWAATDEIWLLGRQMVTSSIGLGAAAEAFCAGKQAEGLWPRSIEWYRMICDRLISRFGAERPVDALTPPELRAWLVELRTHLGSRVRPRVDHNRDGGRLQGRYQRAVINALVADGEEVPSHHATESTGVVQACTVGSVCRRNGSHDP